MPRVWGKVLPRQNPGRHRSPPGRGSSNQGKNAGRGCQIGGGLSQSSAVSLKNWFKSQVVQEGVGASIMPSPFPGMDPYLEAQPYWSTLHANLITAMQGELKKRVPPTYSVWSDVYIWLHEP